MTLDNDKLILIYGFNQEEISQIGELILNDDLIKFKVIDKHSGKMTVENIIQGLKLPTANKSIIEEKLILFNNLDDDELEKSIKVFRKNIDKNTIFAVVTPTSIKWTFEDLLKHLVEERKWIQSRKK